MPRPAAGKPRLRHPSQLGGPPGPRPWLPAGAAHLVSRQRRDDVPVAVTRVVDAPDRRHPARLARRQRRRDARRVGRGRPSGGGGLRHLPGGQPARRGGLALAVPAWHRPDRPPDRGPDPAGGLGRDVGAVPWPAGGPPRPAAHDGAGPGGSRGGPGRPAARRSCRSPTGSPTRWRRSWRLRWPGWPTGARTHRASGGAGAGCVT